MRTPAIIGSALLLVLLGGCGSGAQAPVSSETTMSTPVPMTTVSGVPVGGPAGVVTVPNGETVVLSTSLLGGEADRVEITVAAAMPLETLPDWYSITVYLGIVVRSGVYLASPHNVVLLGGGGAVIDASASTFGSENIGIGAGDSQTGILIFEVDDAKVLDGATVSLYGLAEEATTLVAHWQL